MTSAFRSMLPLSGRSSGQVFGSSALDRALGDYRVACDGVPGFDWLLSQAYAVLGRANRVRPEYRRGRRAEALRAVNLLRSQRRAAVAKRDQAAAAYAALGGNPAAEDSRMAAT